MRKLLKLSDEQKHLNVCLVGYCAFLRLFDTSTFGISDKKKCGQPLVQMDA